MSKETPRKAYREGISMVELFRRWPDDATAEAWFVARRWPEGGHCPHCGSTDVQSGAKHKTMPYRCRAKECAKRFSAKTGTVMEGSKLGFQVWMIATYLLSTSLKSVSSMKLHRDLNINQRSAWFLAHRLRVALADREDVFSGPIEADETYVGGRRTNMPKAKRKEQTGRGTVGKTAVVSVKDRATSRIHVQVIPSTDGETLRSFIRDHAGEGTVVYTDGRGGYCGLAADFKHESVNHSVDEYVRGMAHMQGIKSFLVMLDRAHKGPFHKFSPKYFDRYVQKVSECHNARDRDIIDIMAAFAEGAVEKRLRYRDLIADNSLPLGAQS